jgi:hypothetical protein
MIPHKASMVLIAFGLAFPVSAQAFGINDVLGGVFNAGMELGSAAVSKATDSFRDPEAEKAKRQKQEDNLVAQMNKGLDDIDARTDLSPLQREKLSLTLKQQYQATIGMARFAAEAEERQRAERDKIFTVGGIAGVAGRSVASMPSVATAQANAMVRAGIPQQQSRTALALANNKQGSTILAATQVVAASQVGPQAGQAADKMIAASRAEVADIKEKIEANNPVEVAPAPVVVDNFFSKDLGSKGYVEFVGSGKLSAQLRDALRALGHTIVEDKANAEVVYQFEGEYAVVASSFHEGVIEDIGAFYEAPHEVRPNEKTGGKIKGFFAKGLIELSGAGNALKPPSSDYKQRVIIVANRKARAGKEIRVAAFIEETRKDIIALNLIKGGLQQIIENAGLNGVVAQLALNDPAPARAAAR